MRPIRKISPLTGDPATAAPHLKVGQPGWLEMLDAIKKKLPPVPKNLVILFAAILISLTALGTLYILPSDQKKNIPIRLGLPNFSPTNRPAATATPQPTVKADPTAAWKTFANKSFSIKYPERFTVSEKTLPFNSRYPKVYSHVVFSDAVSDITVTVAKNTPKLTLDTAVGNGPYLRYTANVYDEPLAAVEVDSVDGKMAQSIAAGASGVRADIVVVANGKVYEMSLSPLKADAEVFALMVSTMKLLNQEPSDITDEWPLHIDNAYKFSFRYPQTYKIEYNKVASGSPTLTMVSDDSEVNLDVPKFKVEVQDLKNFGQSAVTSRQIVQLPLDQYVEKKWEYNKAATDSAIPDRVIGPIKQTAVDGKTAYSFSVSGKYIDDHTQEVLSGVYTFVFTEYNGLKYKIWYKTSDSTQIQIFNTFKFL